MSDISSLRAELSRQQSINYELQRQLNELFSGISAAESEMSGFRNHVTGTLQESAQMITNSHERCIRTYEVQGEIDRLYERFKNMEEANKNIRECNNKKYYDFGNYRTVRKIMQGLMDNMNLQMVSDEVIYKSVEKQHLQTPDYWLTCVLISVMAWKNDDRELADRAMQRAIRLDKKACSIFYMIFNLRVHRESAALAWFQVYQTCELRGSDERTFLLFFSLLSKTIDDTVDEHTQGEIYDFINKVISENAASQGFSREDTVREICSYLTALMEQDPFPFAMLQRCCGDCGQLANQLALAQNNRKILQFILQILDVSEEERNRYLSTFLDEQIAQPNQTEKAVYDEIEYNEAVIAANGDLETAKARYGEEQARREKELNLIREMVHWVYGRGRDDAEPQARKNMFLLTGALQQEAVQKYRENYHAMEKSVHPIELGDYQTSADFHAEPQEKQKIEAYYGARRDEALAEVKITKAYLGFGIAVAAAAAAVFMHMLGLLVFTAGGLLFGALTIVNAGKTRRAIEADCAASIAGKQDLLQRLFAEYRDFETLYGEADAVSERIQQTFEQI